MTEAEHKIRNVKHNVKQPGLRNVMQRDGGQGRRDMGQMDGTIIKIYATGVRKILSQKQGLGVSRGEGETVNS